MFSAEDRIFTERRIRLYAVSMAVAIAAVSAWEFLHGRSGDPPPGDAGLLRVAAPVNFLRDSAASEIV
jgi:hypothetical protein